MTVLFSNDATVAAAVTAIESGTYTFTGVKTFDNGLKTDTISEETAAAGVTVDSLIIKDAGITFTDAGELTIATGAVTATGSYHTIDTEADAASDDLDTINGTAAGRELFIQAEHTDRTVVVKHNTGNIFNPNATDISLDDDKKIVHLIYSAALVKWVVTAAPPLTTTVYPNGYLSGKIPFWASVATITLPSGLKARNSTNTADITLSANKTISLASSGANGLDTGAEASNTWYYVYVIQKSSDGTNAGLFSVTNENVSGTVTLPSGYDLKRQLPLAVRNDGSSNILKFYHSGGWPGSPSWMYDVEFQEASTSTASATQVKNNGSDASFTALSLASYVPPLSTTAILGCSVATVGTVTNFRPTGSSLSVGLAVNNADEGINPEFTVLTNSSQSVDYKTSSTRADIWVRGFTVTEI